ncbi:MAG: threonine--tRNA ligase [Sutterella parvirubra]|uniref:Threonine--tRNA ligase n=1 Tax=Sutterella parvirubra YIT 11816 TaxID=762967 RepID=H3KFW3_9BURK|nr:threonine--tRNA ligase [Sutterella parvirubra]EHY30997.1 threonine--tRNA ligase [Sutterella parvirubra YIT 11816]MCI7708177.1 threonine--tRNA ligase [Sutterella parvirubra]MDR3771523.1 threonine--tRNA ligase [Sutterella sp.]MDY5200948.1 threonine--tRNA ligase [Sutterella parvirubra]
MIAITLPDGSKREFEAPVTVADVAASIGAGLAKAALAGRVDGKLVDTSFLIEKDASLAIITAKDAEALELIRHSTAHLMAQAVKQLYPEAQVTIGPAIDNGFYYDFSYKRPFTPEDLEAIEARMHEIVKQDLKVERSEMKREDAVEFFRGMGEAYKAELVEAIPEGEVISLYRQGDFIDLCRGPHVPSTGKLKVFKLMKVAGAYWRGDSNNEMLQRIYGTAFASKEDLAAYLHMLEEAEKRDHRRLGRELDLFHLQDEAPGLIFWHAKGWAIWQVVEQYMRKIYRDNGYEEVKAPQLLDRSLWERSGHWAKYRENMFTTESENRYYALKPMNCPGHIQIFNSQLRSYRDLPLRIGEFGQCHRNEPSGSLHGLMRVRGFTQDDGHIFCTEDQILGECENYTRLVQQVYADFGFKEIAYKVATRPEMRIGEDDAWDKAEHALMKSFDDLGIEYEILEGEGAFYGPKIEYHLKDCLGRSWQCGTIQVDFQMPARLGAEYVAEDNTRKVPVMLHRAMLGSLERWIGMLIEEFAGAFPLWLAPVQVAVCSITDAQVDAVKDVAKKLHEAGIRVHSDLRGEKINYKIRELSLQKIPYILVIGEKEKQNGTVSVRARGGRDLGVMKFEDFLAMAQAEVASRALEVHQEA